MIIVTRCVNQLLLKISDTLLIVKLPRCGFLFYCNSSKISYNTIIKLLQVISIYIINKHYMNELHLGKVIFQWNCKHILPFTGCTENSFTSTLSVEFILVSKNKCFYFFPLTCISSVKCLLTIVDMLQL